MKLLLILISCKCTTLYRGVKNGTLLFSMKKKKSKANGENSKKYIYNTFLAKITYLGKPLLSRFFLL